MSRTRLSRATPDEVDGAEVAVGLADRGRDLRERADTAGISTRIVRLYDAEGLGAAMARRSLSPLAADHPLGYAAHGGDRQAVPAEGPEPRRRARQAVRRLPGRRQRACLPGVLRPARGAPDGGGPPDERPPGPGQHVHADAHGLPAADGARGVGLQADRPARDRGRLQGPPKADARPAAAAAAVVRAGGRGVRLPQPEGRGEGGRRHHRHPRPDGRGCRAQGLRGLDRPRRVPARLRQRLHHDDPARRAGRRRLHARADHPALRDRPRRDPRLHRAQGRHVRQHRRRPGDRRQDRRRAPRPVREHGGRLRQPRRRVGHEAAPVAGRRRQGRRRLEAARHHRPRDPPRRRLRRAWSSRRPTARR